MALGGVPLDSHEDSHQEIFPLILLTDPPTLASLEGLERHGGGGGGGGGRGKTWAHDFKKSNNMANLEL